MEFQKRRQAMKKWLVSRIWLVLACLLALAGIAQAQVPTGTVNGIVTDPKGAVLVGARGVLQNSAQGVSRETVTNTDGVYVFSDLPPGSYELKVEHTGFAAS